MGALLFLLALSASIFLKVSKASAAESTNHPFLGIRDLKSETCLECHPTKSQGKFVHTAVRMGCEKCHQTVSQNYRTTMTLVATGGDLCARCHEAKNDPFQHQPFKAGECLICHNPHAGAYEAQTRAAVDTLCLSCHMLNQPDVKVSAQTSTVALLDERAYELAAFESAPKLGGDHAASSRSRMASDTVIVKKSGKLDAELNCLSCHDPHASQAEHLLHRATPTGGAVNPVCLRYFSKFLPINAAPRSVRHAEDPSLGRQA